jgi:biofilm PGA synthesis protein PgaD
MSELHDIKVDDLVLPDFIYRSDLQTLRQKSTSAVISSLGWIVWVYLFIPLLSAFAWWLGYRRVDRYLIHNDAGFVQQIELIAPIIIVLGAFLLLWAVYNLRRFRNKERRERPTDVTIAEVAHFFEISAEVAEAAQRSQISIYHFDDTGRITAIETEGLTAQTQQCLDHAIDHATPPPI